MKNTNFNFIEINHQIHLTNHQNLKILNQDYKKGINKLSPRSNKIKLAKNLNKRIDEVYLCWPRQMIFQGGNMLMWYPIFFWLLIKSEFKIQYNLLIRNSITKKYKDSVNNDKSTTNQLQTQDPPNPIHTNCYYTKPYKYLLCPCILHAYLF